MARLVAELREHPNPKRSGRTSPRAVKRRTSRYPSRGKRPATRRVSRETRLHPLTARD